MELSDAQKVAVTQWIQEGRSLADVQRSLREDFEISITYMDVRFLVDDLYRSGRSGTRSTRIT